MLYCMLQSILGTCSGHALAFFSGLTHVVLPGSHMRQTDSGTAATLLLLEVVLHTAAALVGSTVTHTLDSSLNSGLNCHMCIGQQQEPAYFSNTTLTKLLSAQALECFPLPCLSLSLSNQSLVLANDHLVKDS